MGEKLFFSEGAFCSGLLLHACPGRNDLLAQPSWGAQCCSQLLSWRRERWVYPLTWKALSQSCEESFGQAEGCGTLEQRHVCLSNASAAVCGIVQQVKCATLSANSSACWLQPMWDKVHSANVEVMGEGKSDYLKGWGGSLLGYFSLSRVLSWLWPERSLFLCACAEGQMLQLTQHESLA